MPSQLQRAIEASRLGHYEAAIAHAESAIASGEDGANPYLCAAYAAGRLRDEAAALTWVERALCVEPDNCLALSAQANLLRVLHRLQPALESCRRWVALEPQNGAAHVSSAQVCQALKMHEEAIAAFRAAARWLPQPAGALTDLAILLFELGRRDEAFQALDGALAADGRYAAAWYTRSEAKRFERGDADIEAMEQQLRKHAAEPLEHSRHDRILLHYALAKAYADLQEFPQVLSHLRSGSSMKRATFEYDAAVDERYMAAMEAAYSSAVIERLRSGGLQTQVPVFIVGMPRSGTSLLEQVLASHPSVHGGGEAAHVQRLIGEFGDAYPMCVPGIAAGRIGELARRYLEMLAPQGAPRMTDKTPYNFLHVGLLHVMFPRARILYCGRDPLDTCLSVYSKLFTQGNEFSYDIDELARYYRGHARLMAHWRAVIPGDRLLEVRYEALVADLETEARRVTDFLQLPWAAACLRFHETQRSVRTASLHQVRQPLYRSSVGRAQRFGEPATAMRDALGDAVNPLRE